MFNFQAFMNAMQNPQQVLMNMGIPKESMQSPQQVVQYLLDNGKVTQQQIDQANQMYKMFRR